MLGSSSVTPSQMSIARSDFQTPTEIQRARALQNEQREMRYALLPPDKYSADIQVDDAAVQSFLRADGGARSLYQALTFRGQLRRKWGQFDAFYTLSKNLDSDSTERNASFAQYENAFDLASEYNYGDLDRRHVVAFSSVLNLPFGFEMATTSRYLSGAPIDVTVSSIVAPAAGSGLLACRHVEDALGRAAVALRVMQDALAADQAV